MRQQINYNPNCPNKNCEGGVITTDGQTGKLCKFCNPPVKNFSSNPLLSADADSEQKAIRHTEGTLKANGFKLNIH